MLEEAKIILISFNISNHVSSVVNFEGIRLNNTFSFTLE